MIIFNENLKGDHLRDFTQKNISPLFKKLTELTTKGEIEWFKSNTSSPYQTRICNNTETWDIHIFDSKNMLVIEWHDFSTEKIRYKEQSRYYRTKFYSLDSEYCDLKERISTGPEILEDCVSVILGK